MSKFLIPCLLLSLISGASPATAQSPDDADIVRKLEQRLHQLEIENAELRAKLLLVQEKSKISKGSFLGERHPQIQTAKSHAVKTAVMAVKHELQAAQEASVVLKQAHTEQAHQLQVALQQLDEELEAVKKTSSTISTTPVAIQAMVQRMAEAQVENRLRMLEARALVEALEEARQHADRASRQKAEIAVEKASLLLEQREEEVELLKQSLSEEESKANQKLLRMQLARAEAGLREARLATRESELLMTHGNRKLDERLSEAAIQVAVSDHVSHLLERETEQLRELLSAGSKIDHLNAQKNSIRRQLAELELQAGQALQKRQLRVMELESKLRKLQAAKEREVESGKKAD